MAAAPDRVRAALAEIGDVAVTHHNAPRQVMIAGTSAGLDRALGVLSGAGLRAERTPVACAAHSPLASAASADLRAELLGRDLRSPAFPVWSNATAAPYDSDPSELAATLAGQLAAPVLFAGQIEAMYAAGARTFVEAGPGRVLTGLVAAILGDRPHTAVSCDAPGGNALAGLLGALAELAAAGVPVDPLPLFAGRDARPLSGEPAPAPGWIVNGHLVRTADGGYPAGGLRPAERIEGPGPGGSEAAVLEYLRASREVIAAQREVVLRHLASPAGRDAAARSVPAPRPVLLGETLPDGKSAQDAPEERPAAAARGTCTPPRRRDPRPHRRGPRGRARRAAAPHRPGARRPGARRARTRVPPVAARPCGDRGPVREPSRAAAGAAGPADRGAGRAARAAGVRDGVRGQAVPDRGRRVRCRARTGRPAGAARRAGARPAGRRRALRRARPSGGAAAGGRARPAGGVRRRPAGAG
ncbi:ACP S-malonyltransferase [Actinomadura luteofluorescens]|uniref:ACP S-malonyltransferase n=1 Tax=Actinomadura luteofluorescens TaxID=46163 RepID=UPI00363E3312